ncbi:2-oxo acid dehydrogenase subunit E2 [Bdellovibrio sp. SKB1291214]|uniref:2-oxo acid dehydrogenase subunit E2 n=1 Tax=Bdellovibrio sp. SKB1291214 TaxID=1732569 RepID=UPI000B5167BB|nr:2-oxo acid dehydrogenase subunit E2 [Bdellovibrio sp. SKB1291214]UYL09928.1 2-oxo acid dehydrogenase subunit E2 [Bdellovibrio sp. SKB1291214]
MKTKLSLSKGGSAFRKIAMGSWHKAGDPTVYGLLEIDMSKALEYMKAQETATGVKLSISHLVGKAAATAMKERPEINGMIRFNRIYLRENVDIFYQVNIPGNSEDPVGKATLTGVVVREAEKMSATQIAQELASKSKAIKGGEQSELTKSLDAMKWVPWTFMRTLLNITSFLNYDLGINLTWAGMPRDAFGSIMITNIGGMGADTAWAPLVSYSKVPILLTVGQIKQRAWVTETGSVEARPVARIGVTFDHRFMDGTHAAALQKIFERCFAEPEKYFGEVAALSYPKLSSFPLRMA